jgi:hypothetical protein
MKVKSCLFLLFIGLSTLMFYAQTTITRFTQCPRPCDELTKQQVEYKDPGRSGTDVLWDFSKLKPINRKYSVEYYTPAVKRSGDSICITCLENRTMYKYVSKGDSLLLMGFENSGSRMLLDTPEYVLHYPFTLGDSIVSFFKGSGSYENTLKSAIEGSLYVVADAIGTLIFPDGDTLTNVLRVKTQHNYQQRTQTLINPRHTRQSLLKDSLKPTLSETTTIPVDSTGVASSPETNETSSSQSHIISNIKNSGKKNATPDSICYRTETYRWYAPGYRYPLFETICNHSRKNQQDTTEIGDIATAFYFPPSMHAYLDNDPQNKAVLDSLQRSKEKGQRNPTDTLFFDYNIYPNPVMSELHVELLLDFPSSVALSVYTTSGNLVLRKDEGAFNAGQNTFTLNLSSIRFGEYLLYIKVNDQVAKSVLLKE